MNFMLTSLKVYRGTHFVHFYVLQVPGPPCVPWFLLLVPTSLLYPVVLFGLASVTTVLGGGGLGGCGSWGKVQIDTCWRSEF